MRASRSLCCALAAALALTGCAHVKTTRESRPEPVVHLPDHPLTHAECVALATHSVPTAAQWRARLASAEAALKAAHTLPNPTFSASFEDFGLFGAPRAPIQQTYSLAYEIAALASRGDREAAAGADLDAARADLEVERVRLASDVWRAYDQLVAARRKLDLAKAAVEIAARERAAAARLLAVGTAARIDVDRADDEAATASAAAASAAADARAKEIALVFALGLPRPLALRLADDQTLPIVVPSPDAMLATAVKRPEIAAERARLSAVRVRAHLADGWVRFLPRIGGGTHVDGSAHRGAFDLEVEVPLFDDGSADRDAASAEVLGALATLRQTAHGIAGEVFGARDRWASASDYVETHARPAALRRARLREATEKLFTAGEAPFVDVSRARRDENDAAVALLEAESDLSDARLAACVAAGTHLTEGPAR